MTRQQFDAKLAILLKKRDQAADVVGNVLLAMTYQQDIDKLVDAYDAEHGEGASLETPAAAKGADRG